VAVTSSPNLVCDLLSPPASIDGVINDVITRKVGEGELYTRPQRVLPKEIELAWEEIRNHSSMQL